MNNKNAATLQGALCATVLAGLLAGPAVADWIPLPAAGTIRFTNSRFVVYEGRYSLAFTMERVGGDDGAVSVKYATVQGSAASNVDYLHRQGEIAWQDQDSALKTIYIPIVEDAINEGDETFSLSLSQPWGVTLGSPTVATGIIASLTNPGLPSYIVGSELGHQDLVLPSYRFINADRGVTGVGDTNGDGREDYLLGAPWEKTFTPGCGEGAAYLLRAALPMYSFSGWNVKTANESYRAHLEGYVGKAATGVENHGAGDVNGDGYADFFVNSTMGLDHTTGLDRPGEAFLVFGTPDDVPSGSLATLSPATGGVRITATGSNLYPSTNSAEGVGDFNGDGVDDFVASNYSGTAWNTYLVLGSTTGFTANPMTLNSAGHVVIGGCDVYQFPGRTGARAIGDVNGDGLADIATIQSNGSSRVIYLYYGSQTVVAGSAANATINGAWDVRTAGDMNADGYDDLVFRVGLAANLLFGSSSGIATQTLPGSITTGTTGVRFTVGDTIGSVRGAGDLNRDGYTDIVLGSSRWTSSGIDENAAYIVYGSASGVGSASRPVATDRSFGLLPPDGTHTSLLTSDKYTLGHEIVHAGDVNLDGVSDLLISNGLFELGDASQICYEDPEDCFLLYGEASTSAATYREYLGAGDVLSASIGKLPDQTHSTPFSRCWIDYHGGSSSRDTVSIYDDNSGIMNLGDLSRLASVCWKHQTTRTNFYSAYIRFKYLDSDITGLDEPSLRIFHAPALSGPWKLVEKQAIDIDANIIYADFDFDQATSGDLGYFAIRDADLIRIEDGDFVTDGQKWQALGVCYDRVQPDLAEGQALDKAYGEAFPTFGDEFLYDFWDAEGITYSSLEDVIFSPSALAAYAAYTPQEIDAIWAAYHDDIDARFGAIDLELGLLEVSGINIVQHQLPECSPLNPERFLPCHDCTFTDRSALPINSEEVFYSHLNRFLRLCKNHNIRVEFFPRHRIPGYAEGAEAMTWPYPYSFSDPFLYDGETRRFFKRIKDRVDPDLWGTIAGWTVTWESAFLYDYRYHQLELHALDWFYFSDKYARRDIYVEEGDYLHSYYGWLDEQWENWLIEQYGSLAAAQAQFNTTFQYRYLVYPRQDSNGDGRDDVTALDPEYCSSASTVRIQAYRRFADDLTSRLYARAIADMKSADDDHFYTSKICGGYFHDWCETGFYNQRALDYGLDVSGHEFYSVSRMLLMDLDPNPNDDDDYDIPQSYVAGHPVGIFANLPNPSAQYDNIRDAVIAHLTFLTRYMTYGGLKPNLFDEGGFQKAYHWDAYNQVSEVDQLNRQRLFYEFFLPAFDAADADGTMFWNYAGSPESSGSTYEEWGLVDYMPKDPRVEHLTVRPALNEIASHASLASKQTRYTRNVTVAIDEAIHNNFQQFGRDATTSIFNAIRANATNYIEVESVGAGAHSSSTDPKDFLLVGDIHSNPVPPNPSRPGPLKYFNSIFDRLEVLDRQGNWKEAKDGDVLHISSSNPVQARVIIGNNGDGTWETANTRLVTKKIDSLGVVTDLYSFSMGNDVTTLERYDLGEVVIAPAQSGKRDVEVNLRLLNTPIGNREFGERIRFTVDSNSISDYDSFDRERSQDLGSRWIVDAASNDDHFVIEDNALVYGRNGENTDMADLVDPATEWVNYNTELAGRSTVLRFDLEWSQAEGTEFTDAPCPSPIPGYPPMTYFTTEGDISEFVLSFDSPTTGDYFQLISVVDEITGTSRTDFDVNGTVYSLTGGYGYGYAVGYRAKCHVEIETEKEEIVVTLKDESGTTIASAIYLLDLTDDTDMSIGFGMLSDVSYRGCDRVTPYPSDFAGFKIDNFEFIYAGPG